MSIKWMHECLHTLNIHCVQEDSWILVKTLQKVIEPLQSFVQSTKFLLTSTNLCVWKYKHLVILKLSVFFHSPAKTHHFLFSMEIQHLLIISTHFQRTHYELVFQLKKDVHAQSPLKPAGASPLVSVLCLDSKNITHLGIYSSPLSVYASFWYLFCKNKLNKDKSSKVF